MAAGYAALLSLLLTALSLTSYHYSGRDRATSSGSHVERNLTLYAMAVGQGDGNIILCPNGRDVLIVDMGAKISQYTDRHYGAYLLKEKFKVVENKMNIHIVVTHTDEDHYNFLPTTFSALWYPELLERVQEIVIGNQFEKYGKMFKRWVSQTDNMPPVYAINGGSECFGNDNCTWTPVNSSLARTRSSSSAVRGDPWQFCGGDVTVAVLGANICAHSKRYPDRCVRDNANARSVVMKLLYKQWSVFLSGDFEGVLQQNKLIKQWSDDLSVLRSTYYKVAHHGTWTDKEANSKELLNTIRPRSAYISHGHPITTFCVKYIHPRCEVIDNLLSIGSIGKADTSPRDSSIVCWKDWTKMIGNLEQRCGYAIYETCNEYDTMSDRQICRDIRITSNGRDDHTSYVDVPASYVYTSKSSYTPKPSCRDGKQDMKRQLSQLNPLCQTF